MKPLLLALAQFAFMSTAHAESIAFQPTMELIGDHVTRDPRPKATDAYVATGHVIFRHDHLTIKGDKAALVFGPEGYAHVRIFSAGESKATIDVSNIGEHHSLIQGEATERIEYDQKTFSAVLSTHAKIRETRGDQVVSTADSLIYISLSDGAIMSEATRQKNADLAALNRLYRQPAAGSELGLFLKKLDTPGGVEKVRVILAPPLARFEHDNWMASLGIDGCAFATQDQEKIDEVRNIIESDYLQEDAGSSMLQVRQELFFDFFDGSKYRLIFIGAYGSSDLVYGHVINLQTNARQAIAGTWGLHRNLIRWSAPLTAAPGSHYDCEKVMQLE